MLKFKFDRRIKWSDSLSAIFLTCADFGSIFNFFTPYDMINVITEDLTERK